MPECLISLPFDILIQWAQVDLVGIMFAESVMVDVWDSEDDPMKDTRVRAKGRSEDCYSYTSTGRKEGRWVRRGGATSITIASNVRQIIKLRRGGWKAKGINTGM